MAALLRAAASANAPPGSQFPEGKHAIIGIDLGTAYSGVSIMVRSRPDIVEASAPRAQPQQKKEPTVLLQTEAGEWLFGNDALDTFKRLMEDFDGEEDNLSPYKLFKTFKFDLMKCEGSEEFEDLVVSAKNTASAESLLHLYIVVLRKLKDYGLECVSRNIGRTPNPGETLWVLTVPAKMSQYCKSFMRQAATGAGMIATSTSDDLMILLEPEAAAIALAHDSTDNFFAVGQRFLVLDCGGGTVDITSHEVLVSSPLTLSSLAMADGGEFGSELINERFVTFLKGLLSEMGPAFMAEVKKRGNYFQQILQEFDAIKVACRPGGDPEKLSLRDLLDSRENQEAFGAVVERYNTANPTCKISKYNKKNGNMTLSQELLLSFFEPSLKEIVDATKRVLADARGRGSAINSIVVVGGFASSEVLQDRIYREFPRSGSIVSLFPTLRLHPQAAVVVGAARGGCLARLPNAAPNGGANGGANGNATPAAPRAGIANRIAQYTYGVFFEPDQFRPLVRKGDDIPVDFMKELVGYPVNLQQTQCQWKLYQSDKKDPTTTTNERFLGSLIVDVPLVGNVREREMRAKFTFGEAEVRIKVSLPHQNKEFTNAIRFTG